MADNNHNSDDETSGDFEKNTIYHNTCKGCGRGYHGNRWDAHHILPGDCFTKARKTDPNGFIQRCLNATTYDINKTYSLAGMPKLTAFILYFQRDDSMPFNRKKENTVTMRRWGKVYRYKQDRKKPIAFPGNIPVHNPVNWGHTEYNGEVLTALNDSIFNKLRKSKDTKEHFKPENVHQKVNAIKDRFWAGLVARGEGPGCGGNVGIEANLRARYQRNNDNWWRPLSMSDIDEPASP